MLLSNKYINNNILPNMKKYSDVGIYGAGAMGTALARNLAGNNYNVTISARTVQKAIDILDEIKKYKESKNISIAENLEDLVHKVKGPIILLISSGDPQQDLITGKSTSPIDDVIFNGSESFLPDGKVKKIKPLCKIVNQNHIIIDAGNSHPYATSIRDLKLTQKKVKFLGMGVSGGEMGALKGPSLMPGGAYSTYKQVEKMLKKIAANSGNTICCDWMGPAGAGHVVKIIHNGIEYAIMQTISEAYWMLKQGLNQTNIEISKFFANCNKGIFKSYLLEITTHIFEEKESDASEYLIDQIYDIAGAKGTGKWTTQIAGDLGIGASAIYAGLEARQLSNKKEDRVKLSNIYKTRNINVSITKSKFISQVRDALFSSILIAYTQGFLILKSASDELTYTTAHKNFSENHNNQLFCYKKRELEKRLDLSKIANIWKSGCIIRSNLLKIIKRAFKQDKVSNLLQSKKISQYLMKYYPNWQKAVISAIQLNIPYQTTSAALQSYNAYRSKKLPANLVQAQRDLFGAHTFQKVNDLNQHHHYWGDKYSLTQSYRA